MNKLLIFPLALLICLSILSVLGAGSTITGQYNTSGGGDVQFGSEGTTVNSNFILPALDLSTLAGALIILGIALGIAGAASFNLLGSGFSVMGQQMIFQASIYLGMWGCFSVTSSKLLFSIPIFGIIIWLVLTTVYVLGFARTIEGSAA